MKKQVILFLLSLCILSCIAEDEVDFYGRKKIIFEGKIVNRNQLPLNGIPVQAYFSTTSSASGVIGSYTTTDANGFYRMIFPAPSNAHDVRLLVNNDHSGNYLSASVGNIPLIDTDQYRYTFNTVNLFTQEDATILTLQLNDTDFQNEYPLVSLSGLVNYEQEYFNYSYSNYNNDPSDVLFGDSTFQVAKNQTIIIKCKFYDSENNFTITEDEIIIGDSPVTYTINY